MPEKFNVKIYKNLNKENVVNKSKTTGEPPLMLAMSVFFAIKDAIASVESYKFIFHTFLFKSFILNKIASGVAGALSSGIIL